MYRCTRTPASDLFALGATLYEAAEGRRPFVATTPIATMLSVLHTDPEPVLGGTLLGRTIDALLAKDPSHRFTAHEAYALLKEAECHATGQRIRAVSADERFSCPSSVEAA
jgi:serine/threonine protein kinase